MPTEHYTPPTPDQYTQRTGTTFEHGHQIDLHASNLASLEAERARADILTAVTPGATQPLESTIQERQKQLEYRPLTQPEVIKLMGRKVVIDLRKGRLENTLNIFDDTIAPAPYIHNPTDSNAEYVAKSWGAPEQTQSSQEGTDSKEASWKGFNEQSF